jgi:putative transposase
VFFILEGLFEGPNILSKLKNNEDKDMARANRHYIPDNIWHITHRCHKKEYLLKFSRDRQRWIYWLFEAKKRYGLCILNYVVTSNHVHQLVVDTKRDVIPQSMQLIAGRTGQEFNQRKSRKGAFWEDRYHAVAVETEQHLVRCLVYIDLNMVRAGVVKHPVEWPFGGYCEIQQPPKRYKLIDQEALVEKCGRSGGMEKFRQTYKHWVNERLNDRPSEREPVWSESIAVGSERFIAATREKLGYLANGRKIIEKDDTFSLREPHISYNTDFDHQNSLLSFENAYYWNVYNE